jgi:hypothetical protein
MCADEDLALECEGDRTGDTTESKRTFAEIGQADVATSEHGYRDRHQRRSENAHFLKPPGV